MLWQPDHAGDPPAGLKWPLNMKTLHSSADDAPAISNRQPASNHLIASRNNVHLKRVRMLQQRESRDRTGLFVLEGIRHLAQAVEQNARIETLLVAPAMLTNTFGQRLVRKLRIAGTPCYRLTPEGFYSISQAEEPQGVAAVVRQRWERLEAISPAKGSDWLVLEAIQSPGNLGTILRTNEAVGGAGVILLDNDTDPYDSACVRSSMGALFGQRFVRASVEQFVEWKERHRLCLVGTSPGAQTDYQAAVYPRPTLLLMGCERKGLSVELMSLCDLTVRLPMVGSTDSLNVAVAAGVMLYELFNQRRGRIAAGFPREEKKPSSKS